MGNTYGMGGVPTLGRMRARTRREPIRTLFVTKETDKTRVASTWVHKSTVLDTRDPFTLAKGLQNYRITPVLLSSHIFLNHRRVRVSKSLLLRKHAVPSGVTGLPV